jgi:hypothetical protein
MWSSAEPCQGCNVASEQQHRRRHWKRSGRWQQPGTVVAIALLCNRRARECKGGAGLVVPPPPECIGAGSQLRPADRVISASVTEWEGPPTRCMLYGGCQLRRRAWRVRAAQEHSLHADRWRCACALQVACCALPQCLKAQASPTPPQAAASSSMGTPPSQSPCHPPCPLPYRHSFCCSCC